MAVVCSSGYVYSNGRCVEYSAWYWWGRWVLTGIVVLSIIAILLLCGCITARRRRKSGVTPYYGTGWMGGPPKYSAQNPNPNGPGPGGYYPPPPQYSGPAPPNSYPMQDQPTGQTFNRNDGYYGSPGQDTGVSPPPNAYTGPGGPVYSPPPGPPPNHKA